MTIGVGVGTSREVRSAAAEARRRLRVSDVAREIVERTCREQGVPVVVRDASALSAIARILASPASWETKDRRSRFDRRPEEVRREGDGTRCVSEEEEAA